MPAETLLHELTDSPACAKARICLTLKGVAFRRMTLTVRGLRRLRALNPLLQVPVLEHDGRVLADSTAILRYLEQRFPDPPLLPAPAAPARGARGAGVLRPDRGLGRRVARLRDGSVPLAQPGQSRGRPRHDGTRARRWSARALGARRGVPAALPGGRLLGRQPRSLRGASRWPALHSCRAARTARP